jgi:hypothetical protein
MMWSRSHLLRNAFDIRRFDAERANVEIFLCYVRTAVKSFFRIYPEKAGRH